MVVWVLSLALSSNPSSRNSVVGCDGNGNDGVGIAGDGAVWNNNSDICKQVEEILLRKRHEVCLHWIRQRLRGNGRDSKNRAQEKGGEKLHHVILQGTETKEEQGVSVALSMIHSNIKLIESTTLSAIFLIEIRSFNAKSCTSLYMRSVVQNVSTKLSSVTDFYFMYARSNF